jgi:hypothetical protein
MLLSITETFIGLAILNISWYSLKKSVIRRWRQGFTISFIFGVIIMLYGLIGLIIPMPVILDNIVLVLSMCGMTSSSYLISRMQGLEA